MDKKMTPEEWEASVKESVMEYLDHFLDISKTCNMGTLYTHPIKVEYETHTELDQDKVSGVELRVVFDFEAVVDKDKMTFI